MSAAGGRYSELSEWQRSKKSKTGEILQIFSGTATGGGFCRAKDGGREIIKDYFFSPSHSKNGIFWISKIRPFK